MQALVFALHHWHHPQTFDPFATRHADRSVPGSLQALLQQALAQPAILPAFNSRPHALQLQPHLAAPDAGASPYDPSLQHQSLPLAYPSLLTPRPLTAAARASVSVLGQVASQLAMLPAALLRSVQPSGSETHVAAAVRLLGEDALGQAGPYRQMLNDVANETTSSSGLVRDRLVGPGQPSLAPWFQASATTVPSANARARVGEARDARVWTDHTAEADPASCAVGLGTLMGMALRTHAMLPLGLSAMAVWQLVGMPLGLRSALPATSRQPASGSVRESTLGRVVQYTEAPALASVGSAPSEPVLSSEVSDDPGARLDEALAMEPLPQCSAPCPSRAPLLAMLANVNHTHTHSLLLPALAIARHLRAHRACETEACVPGNIPLGRCCIPYLRSFLELSEDADGPAAQMAADALLQLARGCDRGTETVCVPEPALWLPMDRADGSPIVGYATAHWLSHPVAAALSPQGHTSLSLDALLSAKLGPAPSPAHVPVSLTRLRSFAHTLAVARLTEGLTQAAITSAAMHEVFPAPATALMSPSAFAAQLMGAADVDLDLLAQHTHYSAGLSPDMNVVKWFWAALRDASPTFRANFVQFAYAQRTLPTSAQGYKRPPGIRMVIKPARATPISTPGIIAFRRAAADADSPARTPADTAEDGVLPHADTCFFSISLPAYSSPDVLMRQLTAALATGNSMGGDDILAQQQTQPLTQPAPGGNAALMSLLDSLGGLGGAGSLNSLPPPASQSAASEGTGNRSEADSAAVDALFESFMNTIRDVTAARAQNAPSPDSDRNP
jgi:hypothetical protein